MKDQEIDTKLIRRLTRDRFPRVVGGIAGLVFLGFACAFAILAQRAIVQFEAASPSHATEHLPLYVLCFVLFTVHLLYGVQLIARAIMGNPVGKLVAQLYERLTALEKQLEESEQ
ncbi:hypothetical protein BVX94_03125 [bacterium B17]|nr:hypothetical protein BVX94_03125 [bacterium B17]